MRKSSHVCLARPQHPPQSVRALLNAFGSPISIGTGICESVNGLAGIDYLLRYALLEGVRRILKVMKRTVIPVLALAGALALPVSSVADPWKDESGHGHRGGPPPWAPAHGYRRKHENHQQHREREPEYRDQRGPVAEVEVSREPIIIKDGSCNRETAGAVLGGIVGGVIGNQVGRHNGNTEVGTVAGAIIGVVVGKRIGEDMDKRDANCAAQALDRAEDGQMVRWRNPDSGRDFQLTPTETYRRDGVLCRRYRAETVRGDEQAEGRSEACRTSDGRWRFGVNTQI